MATTQRRSDFERALGVFTEVRAGEGITALLLTLNVYLLMTSYYIIKPVREALILTGGGAELKAYTSAGQADHCSSQSSGADTTPLSPASVPREAQLINTGDPVLRGVSGRVSIVLARGSASPTWAWRSSSGSASSTSWSSPRSGRSRTTSTRPAQGKRIFATRGVRRLDRGGDSGVSSPASLIAPLGIEQMLLVAAGILLASTLLLTNADRRA